MVRFSQNLTLIVLFLGALFSCEKKIDRNPEFLPPFSIEIPKELEENQEAVAFIRSSEKTLNEFSDRIEELVYEGKDILNKDPESLTLGEKLTAGRLAVQFVTNSSQMTNEMQKVNRYIEKARSKGWDESQIAALKTVEQAMEDRLDQIEKKYGSYFKE